MCTFNFIFLCSQHFLETPFEKNLSPVIERILNKSTPSTTLFRTPQPAPIDPCLHTKSI